MPKVIDVDNLFEATVRVFAEHGYDAATTQEIAKAAGVNEVTLFRRYGNKATLIEAALTRCLRTSPFAEVVASDDVKADLAVIVSAYEQTYRAYGGAVFTLLSEMHRHPELRNAVAALMPNLENAARIIAVHQGRGRIGLGDPLQKVLLLIAPVMAAGLWARAGARKIVPEFDQRVIVDLFLDGHRPARSARAHRVTLGMRAHRKAKATSRRTLAK